jgi:hypothetical protein
MLVFATPRRLSFAAQSACAVQIFRHSFPSPHKLLQMSPEEHSAVLPGMLRPPPPPPLQPPAWARAVAPANTRNRRTKDGTKMASARNPTLIAQQTDMLGGLGSCLNVNRKISQLASPSLKEARSRRKRQGGCCGSVRAGPP